MREFQPIVTVTREYANYGIFSPVIEGTAKIKIEDMCGFDFINENVRNQFIMEVEEFKSSLSNAPDNFDNNDRERIKSFVEELLISYYETGKLVKN